MVALRQLMPPDAILCNGAGNYASWIHRFYRFRRFGTHMAPTSASMGYGMPAAVAIATGSPVGLIVVTGRRRNPKTLLFSVRDDGSGLNFEQLRRRGVELGMLSPGASDGLDREQAIELLCASGFTTFQEPSPDGGRGVGLDAVRELLDWLGGRIDVDSKPGQYTDFTVELPG